MIKVDALLKEEKCSTCGKTECSCQKQITKFNKSLKKCKECNLPIYEGMDHTHITKRKVQMFIEEVEKRAAQRKKKTKMIIIGNLIWLLIVAYYVIFDIPLEIYVFIFIVFVFYILIVSKWVKVHTFPSWDELQDDLWNDL